VATTTEVPKGLHHAVASPQSWFVSEIIRLVTKLHEFARTHLDRAIVPGPDVPNIVEETNLDAMRSQGLKYTVEDLGMMDLEHGRQEYTVRFPFRDHAR